MQAKEDETGYAARVRDGHRMAKAFQKINNPKVRERLIDAAEQAVRDQEQAAT